LHGHRIDPSCAQPVCNCGVDMFIHVEGYGH
jgi:hypothetical protein